MCIGGSSLMTIMLEMQYLIVEYYYVLAHAAVLVGGGNIYFWPSLG